MSGQFDFITLIALIVAVVAIIKLKNVLGHRTDDDEQRVERLRTRQREASQRAGAEAASADVITMPRRDHETGAPAPAAETSTVNAETRAKAYPVTDPAVTTGLLEIAKLDPEFDPQAFVDGAGRAYEMIVSAFAEGNRRMLKDLLSKDVFEGFSSAIGDRESREETLDQQFVGIKKSEIVEAEVKGGVAMVTIRFASELISAIRDKAGEVISGDAQKIKDVTDIWTFSRDISTAKARSNPNWRLMATQAPN
jgi:predicted lipid-binding transport protein (Tim44 family)